MVHQADTLETDISITVRVRTVNLMVSMLELTDFLISPSDVFVQTQEYKEKMIKP